MKRREFSLALGALSSGILHPAFAQSVRILRVANTAAVNDPQQCFTTAGQSSRLNFYKSGGVDVEYVNMSNMTQAMQSLQGGHVEYGPAVPGMLLPAMAKDPALLRDLVVVYKWLPRNVNVIVVKPGSSIKSAGDLAGKRVGVRSLGDAGGDATRTMLSELGLKDSGVEYIAIGDGAPAGAAIDNDRVDAMVTFDTVAARIELIGTKLRYVPITPEFSQVGSGWLCVPRKLLKEDRKSYVKLFQGIAKSTIFANTNIDAAIDLHWSVYPESRPKGRSLEDARKEMKFILKDRKDNWMRRVDDSDQRMGASSAVEWKSNVEVAAATSKNPRLSEQIGDVNKLFTNELIDDVNNFDRSAIIQMARDFKY